MAKIVYCSRRHGPRMADAVEIGSAAPDSYPAPLDPDEYAVVAMAGGHMRYGYHGGWHAEPPAGIPEEQIRWAESAEREWVEQEIAVMPPLYITKLTKFGVLVSGPRGRVEMDWEALDSGASGHNAVSRAVCRSILAAVKRYPRGEVRKVEIRVDVKES